MKVVKQGEHNYQIGKMSPRAQFHVARRLAPVLANLAPIMFVLRKNAAAGEELPLDLFAATAMPLAQGIAQMPDTEADYILNTCLSVVSREQAGGQFAPVLAADNMTFMFADLAMQDLLQLSVAVVQENLGNFFDLLPVA